MKNPFPRLKEGQLVQIVDVPDQSHYTKIMHVGMNGVVLRRLTKEDGIVSSDSMYLVILSSGKCETFHYLDLKIIENERTSL
jgi:hypothetical protein